MSPQQMLGLLALIGQQQLEIQSLRAEIARVAPPEPAPASES